ncbi:hypothetical protein KEM56_005184, partial [Ascosphaera pollenicola]
MVYYKRKPVQLVARPEGLKDEDHVWVIAETNEVFHEYEEFLERMNFYKQVCFSSSSVQLCLMHEKIVNIDLPQKQFVCEGTGHSSLTFFEALKSERDFIEEVNRLFPEALKVPVLRRVQFSTTSRIDHLVDQVYEEFKSDFYPGERVAVLLQDGTRLQGTVREKARFPESFDKDGNVARRAMSKYLVKIIGREDEEALLSDEHIVRDRRIFTKVMLKGFLKNSLHRESWTGAPWTVKPAIAEKYHIDTQIPKHLQFEQSRAAALGARRGPSSLTTPSTPASDSSRTTTPRAYLKDGSCATDENGMFGLFASGSTGVGPKGGVRTGTKRKSRSLTQEEMTKAKEQSLIDYQKTLNGKPQFTVNYPQATAIHGGKAGAPTVTGTLPMAPFIPLRNGVIAPVHQGKQFHHVAVPTSDRNTPYSNPVHAAVAQAAAQAAAEAAGAQIDTFEDVQIGPPAVRYPIEDLDVPPITEHRPRPPLKFLEEDVEGANGVVQKRKLDTKTVGGILETWNTLNVYAELLKLDSFTFDDYIDAIGYTDSPTDGNIDSVARCELLVEIHCAILKLIVEPVEPKTSSSSNPGPKDDNEEDDVEEEEEIGNLLIDLPLLPEEEPDDEDEDGDDDEENNDDTGSGDEESPQPERQSRRITRSRTVARAEAEAAEQARLQAEEENAKLPHCAPLFFESPSTDWIARLAKREFRNGGWELILIGLLNRLTYSTRQRVSQTAVEVLTKFVPASLLETYSEGKLEAHAASIAGARYKRHLGLRERVIILEMLEHLLMETTAVRQFLDECATRSTELRKEKTEIQKKRKLQLQVVRKLHKEKRALIPKKDKDAGKNDKDGKETKTKKEEGQDDSIIDSSGGGDADDSDIDGDGDGTEDMDSSVAPDTDVEEDRLHDVSTPGNETLQKQIEKNRRKGTNKNTKGKAKSTQSSQALSSDSCKSKTKPKDKEKDDKALAKILAKITAEKAKVKDLERQILNYDDQLRELDTSRTRCLGIDRFWNRYYWFERNGMPFEGRRDSSTASAGYSNGRLWLLGPDETEVKGFMDSPVLARATMASYGLTVIQRREREEGAAPGSGGVLGHGQWGYYDEPEELDKLLEWLDSRGNREIKLRKEVQAFA